MELPFFVIKNMNLKHSFFPQTEIIRSDEILDGHLTMKEVCRIYGLYSKVSRRGFDLLVIPSIR